MCIPKTDTKTKSKLLKDAGNFYKGEIYFEISIVVSEMIVVPGSHISEVV